jgi:WD40 repeat protein
MPDTLSKLSPPCSNADCPTTEQLQRLLRGDSSGSEDESLVELVGRCQICQQRLEELATGGDSLFPELVRHIDDAKPAEDSAYWEIFPQISSSTTRTATYEPDILADHARGVLSLDFLEPIAKPGRIGRLGSFEVTRVLGRGGMGVVLEGFDPDLQRDVALKILDPQLANDPTMRQRFCREARAAAAVSHDNLVAVYQVDEDQKSGLPFLVMQLVNGESLEQRLRRVGRLTPLETARIGMQAAAGLAGAHACGLIHRDIKPGNILIEAGTEKVKLTDFGLARATVDMKLTRTGFVAGTPLYMSPEQARGEEIDHRADLFSLGSVLYEALAGTPAFDGKTPLAVLRRVADDPPVPLHRVNPDVPPWLEEIIETLLAKNPADRYQSAAEVADILASHLHPLAAHNRSADHCPGFLNPSRMTRRRIQACWKKLLVLSLTFLLGSISGSLLTVWLLPKTPNSKLAIADPGPEPIAILPARSGAIWSVALSQDGSTMVMGIENGRISVWDVPGRRLKFDLHPATNDQAPAHKGPVWALDFTPDGKQLISASDDGTIKIWDLPSGRQRKSIPVGTPVRTAAISPSGAWVAIGDRFGEVSVFDLAQERILLQYQQESTVNGVSFCPDNLTLASVSTDGTVVLWEIAGKRKRFTLTGHGGPVYGLSFSPDSRELATSSWDKTVILWDVDTGTLKKQFKAHDEGVLAVQYSPDGTLLATAGQDGVARIWDSESTELLATFRRHQGTIFAASFDKFGDLLATGGQDGTVRIWDVGPLDRASRAAANLR